MKWKAFLSLFVFAIATTQACNHAEDTDDFDSDSDGDCDSNAPLTEYYCF